MKRLVFMALVLISTPLLAQQPLGFNEWIAQRREEILLARADQANVATKQVESPAAADGSTSLVDQSSSADLFSAALNFAGFSSENGGQNDDAKTLSFTAYSLIAAASRKDPLDPVFYNAGRPWRHLSFTIGSDDAGSLYSLKYNLTDRRDAHDLKGLDEPLRNANIANINSGIAIVEFIQGRPDLRQKLVQTAAVPPDPGNDTAVETLIRNGIAFETIFDDEDLEEIDRIIESQIEPFEDLNKVTERLVTELRAKLQVSLTGTYKRRTDGADGTVAALVLDKGMTKNLMFSANAGYEATQADGAAPSSNFWRAAAQLRYQLPFGDPDNRRFLDFAAEANNKSDENTFKAQVKVTLPVVSGVDLPISLTWANRQELLDEEEIRGLIGFTIDYSQILEAFRGRK